MSTPKMSHTSRNLLNKKRIFNLPKQVIPLTKAGLHLVGDFIKANWKGFLIGDISAISLVSLIFIFPESDWALAAGMAILVPLFFVYPIPNEYLRIIAMFFPYGILGMFLYQLRKSNKSNLRIILIILLMFYLLMVRGCVETFNSDW